MTVDAVYMVVTIKYYRCNYYTRSVHRFVNRRTLVVPRFYLRTAYDIDSLMHIQLYLPTESVSHINIMRYLLIYLCIP